MPAGGTVTNTRPSVTTRPTSEHPERARAAAADGRSGAVCRHRSPRSGAGRADAGAAVTADATSAVTGIEAARARSRRVVMPPILPGRTPRKPVGVLLRSGRSGEQHQVVAVHDLPLVR